MKLRAAFKEGLKSPVLTAILATSADEPDGTMGDELAHDQRMNRERWRKLANARKIAFD